jgi:putative acetyltransferase
VVGAVVQGRTAYWLPGGGALPGETPEETALREVREELGRAVRLVARVGEAVQYFYAANDGCWYEMTAVFFRAEFEGEASTAGEHELCWLDAGGPGKLFFHACHAWAVARACDGQGPAGGAQEAGMVTIRPERDEDADAIRAVHRAAFPTDAEARLVDRLRAAGRARVALVAELDGAVVGHILFSPVVIVSPSQRCSGLGLAPLAVLPACQRRGVGSALVHEGLAACRRAGCDFVVVLGHPKYYPRFGFRRASAMGLGNEYGADEAFLVLELRPGSLPAGGGLVLYGPEFAEWRRT